MRLNHKVALVTGAARGIGEAIASAFFREGAIVYFSDINREHGQAVVDQLDHVNARYIDLDVRLEDNWKNVIEHILQREGQLDILVNNAGITGFENGAIHDPEHAELAEWRAVHHTNSDGTFLGCKYAIYAMRPKRSGSIINISSRSGLVGIPGAAAYASSKASVRNHSKTVALYCAEQGLNIRCNSIHPAAILTPMWDAMLGQVEPERQQRMQAFAKGNPLQRFGTSTEVAHIALLLASDEATYITGSEFNIDGGLLAGTALTPSVVEVTDAL